MKKKKAEMKPDGKFEEADAVEAHPDFHDEYHDMAERVIKKTNPGLHALMQRVKGAPVEKPT